MKVPAIAFSLSAAVLACLAFPTSLVQAQNPREIAAKAALINVANRYGADKVQWIVELRGFYGQPQPKEWEIVVHDPGMPQLLHEFWAGQNGDVSDEGPSKDFYPKRSPTGFIKLSDLKLDSKAAFTVAEGEARKAKMGFNAVNFYLRCREYSREPIWTLELVDINEDLAGKIYISGSTAEVLRTVWYYRGERGGPDGRPILIDSAAPQAGGERGTELRSMSSNSVPGPESGTGSETGSPLGGLPPIPPGITGGQPVMPSNPSPGPVPRPPVPSGDPDANRIPKPPVPPPSGGGSIDTTIPPPPVPPQN